MGPLLTTPRLELAPMSLAMVEAVMLGKRETAEAIAEAKLPDAWPGAALIERAFSASLDRIRAAPEERLWGDRLIVIRSDGNRGPRCIVGSVVFHGRPGPDGVAEVAYGVEEASQGLGYATEATRACVDWALTQPGVVAVTATTAAWHRASLRVIQKIGMSPIGTRDHDLLGELLVFELRR